MKNCIRATQPFKVDFTVGLNNMVLFDDNDFNLSIKEAFYFFLLLLWKTVCSKLRGQPRSQFLFLEGRLRIHVWNKLVIPNIQNL